ncbi:hypothetical protein [Hyphomicrobium sp. DY-1]|uniref:hypothetical protein n=1 Tax=Hyphomicrobium sp. DY-1 TaxID=3075650 RepID=UPI0039C07CCA
MTSKTPVFAGILNADPDLGISLGKGEVESSIPSGSTSIFAPKSQAIQSVTSIFRAAPKRPVKYVSLGAVDGQISDELHRYFDRSSRR